MLPALQSGLQTEKEAEKEKTPRPQKTREEAKKAHRETPKAQTTGRRRHIPGTDRHISGRGASLPLLDLQHGAALHALLFGSLLLPGHCGGLPQAFEKAEEEQTTNRPAHPAFFRQSLHGNRRFAKGSDTRLVGVSVQEHFSRPNPGLGGGFGEVHGTQKVLQKGELEEADCEPGKRVRDPEAGNQGQGAEANPLEDDRPTDEEQAEPDGNPLENHLIIIYSLKLSL